MQSLDEEDAWQNGRLSILHGTGILFWHTYLSTKMIEFKQFLSDGLTLLERKIIFLLTNDWKSVKAKNHSLQMSWYKNTSWIISAINDIFSWKSTWFSVADENKLLLLWKSVNNNELFLLYLLFGRETSFLLCVLHLWFVLWFWFCLGFFLIGVQASLFYGLHKIKPCTKLPPLTI